MEYLILLNRKFPYKSGEAFLENEIEEISGAFDKILIYPSDVCKSDGRTRDIKSRNVETRILETRSLTWRQLSYSFNAIRYISRGEKPDGIIRKLIEGYFLAAANEQSKKTVEDLGNFEFGPDDTVYVYSYWFYTNAKVACLLKKHFEEKGIRVVAFSRAHRFDIYEEKRKFSFLPQRETMFRELNRIYACSDNGAEYLQNRYPSHKQKIGTSYLGTYDHGMGPENEGNNFRIVSCSRVTDVKRVHLIAEALKLLKSENLSLAWTHIGGGILFDKLNEKAKELDWMEVNLLGSIPNSEVYEHYHSVPEDLFINVSSSEGLPVSIMEAISFGIPVIATDAGGTSEIVVDDVSGKLIDADFTIEELAKWIKYYAELDRKSYSKLRHDTRAMWEEHYRASENYRGFIKSVKGLSK